MIYWIYCFLGFQMKPRKKDKEASGIVCSEVNTSALADAALQFRITGGRADSKFCKQVVQIV